MLAQLDAATHPVSCACCGGASVPFEPREVVATDIVCDLCGRPIYRAVTPAA